jgi:hypothetical protein
MAFQFAKEPYSEGAIIVERFSSSDEADSKRGCAVANARNKHLQTSCITVKHTQLLAGVMLFSPDDSYLRLLLVQNRRQSPFFHVRDKDRWPH